jgi:NhaP-type Na+/H+ or K+/H+ antiporter
VYTNLAILTIFAFFYSVFARGIERTWIAGPIIFTAFGFFMGPLGLGILTLDVTSEKLRTLAEISLALVLFNDASNANLSVLKDNLLLPKRLLGIGLPLTILLGFIIGILLFDELSFYEIAILATMLAATDAALGKPVITNKMVPPNIREGLNMESGLNDGICVPILYIFIDLALSQSKSGGLNHALQLITKEIGIGLVVGILLAALSGKMLKLSLRHDWLSGTWKQITIVALAVACFSAAQTLGGSGFIAAFSGGLLFGKITKHHKEELLRGSEATGNTFALLTWIVFGSAVIEVVIDHANWSILLYSLLSLTLVRMLPVFISLANTGESTGNKLFLGWFGPRGLASIVFGIIVLDKNLPGGDTMATVVVCTVCLSIVAHGITALPMSTKIGEMAAKQKK